MQIKEPIFRYFTHTMMLQKKCVYKSRKTNRQRTEIREIRLRKLIRAVLIELSSQKQVKE